jgi:CheY-like chemotaxis protein
MEDGDKYVLIVDDDSDAQWILSKVLEGLGLKTRTASDGLEALACIEVFTYLRGNAATRHVPVIVVSALSLGQEDMLKLPGVTEVVKKSHFQVDELQSKVGALLDIPPDSLVGNPHVVM